jgi:hypothetical protein
VSKGVVIVAGAVDIVEEGGAEFAVEEEEVEEKGRVSFSDSGWECEGC